VEKIVLNLKSNAFKFTFEGGIRVTLQDEPGHVVLEVSDTGVGIPSGQLGNLFRRFHRVPTARARTHEGSGIGLALVHELVRLHGGTVAVESEEGRGATFRVRIPATHADVAASGTARPAAGGTTGAVEMADEMMRWLPRPGTAPPPEDTTKAPPATPPMRSSTRAPRPARTCWWRTITPTCASTCAASSSRAGACGPPPTASRH